MANKTKGVKKIYSLMMLLLVSQLTAQTQFGPRITIDTFAHDAQQVSSGDLDGDGDIDAVAIMRDEHRVSWYENTDGQGSFGPEQIIATVSFGKSIFIADFDGDGDLDIASGGATHIYWHENNGSGSFNTTHTITAAANGAESIYAADLDGDGDLDLTSVSSGADKLCWYDNTDGLGSFGPQIIISTGPDYGEGVWAADINGDGDIDLITASYLDDEVAWYENLGNGSWGPTQIISNTQDGAQDVFVADLDGDLDMDVVAASWGDNTIAWFENTDGLGSFGPEQLLSSGIPARPYTVYGGDIDFDGDIDIVGGGLYELGWMENTNGQGNFASYQQIEYTSNDAHRVELADLDNDNDLDVLASTTGADYVAWYENNPCVTFSDTLTPIACDSYTVPSGSRSYTTGGYFTDTLMNAAGCDSILRIQLTVNYSSSSSWVETVCDTFVSPSGKIWTLSNLYTDTIANHVGCDSIMSIDLTVNYSSYGYYVFWGCDSIISPSGKIWRTSGNFIDTVPTVYGCDSILDIVTGIYPSKDTALSISACDSFVSPSGIWWYSSGVYSDTLFSTTGLGCDSIIEIDLDLTYSYDLQSQLSSCGPLIAPSGMYYDTPGLYSDTLYSTTLSGCDSTYVTQLEIYETNDSVYAQSNVLTAYLSGPMIEHQWLDCSNGYSEINGATSSSFSPGANGSYAVEITNNNGTISCVDTSVCLLVQNISLNDRSESLSFDLYPNPTSGRLHLAFENVQNLLVLKLYSVSGQLLKQDQFEAIRSVDWEMNVPNGLYILQVEDGKGLLQNVRIVKE